jgi:hypothetical protein
MIKLKYHQVVGCLAACVTIIVKITFTLWDLVLLNKVQTWCNIKVFFFSLEITMG